MSGLQKAGIDLALQVALFGIVGALLLAIVAATE